MLYIDIPFEQATEMVGGLSRSLDSNQVEKENGEKIIIKSKQKPEWFNWVNLY